MEIVNIEDVHKENLKLIKKYNIKVGTILREKDNPHNIQYITHIHPLYGWIGNENIRPMPQRVSEALEQYEIINENKI